MYLTGTLLSRFAALPRIYALLAQSVEHFHGKEKVVGSIPTEGSASGDGCHIYNRPANRLRQGDVAQLVRASGS